MGAVVFSFWNQHPLAFVKGTLVHTLFQASLEHLEALSRLPHIYCVLLSLGEKKTRVTQQIEDDVAPQPGGVTNLIEATVSYPEAWGNVHAQGPECGLFTCSKVDLVCATVV